MRPFFFKRPILLLFLIVLLTGCTQKYLGLEPEFTDRPLSERVEESKKFTFDAYKYPLPEYWWISMNGKKYRPNDLEHVMEATRPGSYKEWRKTSWGSTIAYVAIIPMSYFLFKTTTDFDLTNLLLLGASGGAFAYGAYHEMEQRNKILRDHNHALRVKFNLLRYEF
ncbi:MAG: hypothetical protein ACPGJV_09520 [Bacteriovoracaceae bacterium]